ncbi:hypothetical protein ADEAN_000517800 [Angomonas deanei]|uniref:Uncharacterized protein n=1 Tax=Angomonas deanei TaxID=59799 RepID=A0A7G2CCZ2_9TRYP|nr:hypothetical protein ADEAN_000517800 [Angomonas deanei]
MSQYLRLTALPAPANQRLPYGLKTEPEGVFYNAHDNTINIIQSTGCIFSFRYYPRSSWALTNRIDRRALPAVPVCGKEGEEAPRMEKALERYTQLPGYVAPLDPTALRRLSSYYYSVLRSHSLPSGATGSPFHNDFDLHADKQWQPPHKANRYVELELVDCYATYNPGQMQLSEFRDVFLPRSASTLPLPTYRWDREKIQSVQTALGEAAGGPVTHCHYCREWGRHHGECDLRCGERGAKGHARRDDGQTHGGRSGAAAGGSPGYGRRPVSSHHHGPGGRRRWGAQ